MWTSIAPFNAHWVPQPRLETAGPRRLIFSGNSANYLPSPAESSGEPLGQGATTKVARLPRLKVDVAELSAAISAGRLPTSVSGIPSCIFHVLGWVQNW